MESVGAFYAKTHLNQLLERVSRGETIEITRRGVPVARLVAASAGTPKDLHQVAAEIRGSRNGVRLGGLSIRKLIDEGR